MDGGGWVDGGGGYDLLYACTELRVFPSQQTSLFFISKTKQKVLPIGDIAYFF